MQTKTIEVTLPEPLWQALNAWAAVYSLKCKDIGIKGAMSLGSLVSAMLQMIVLENQDELRRQHQEVLMQYRLAGTTCAEAASADIATILPHLSGAVLDPKWPKRKKRTVAVYHAAWRSAGVAVPRLPRAPRKIRQADYYAFIRAYADSIKGTDADRSVSIGPCSLDTPLPTLASANKDPDTTSQQTPFPSYEGKATSRSP